MNGHGKPQYTLCVALSGARSPSVETERAWRSSIYALCGTFRCPFTLSGDRTGTASLNIRSVWHFPVPVHPPWRPNGHGKSQYTLCVALSGARSPSVETERARRSSIYALCGTFRCPFTLSEDRTGTAILNIRSVWHFLCAGVPSTATGWKTDKQY